jgi:hypothetical protein
MSRPLLALAHETGTHREILRLTELAVRGLAFMYDPERKLFCHRLRQSNGSLVREGISQRYTTISLLGLQRLQVSGIRSAIDIAATLDTLLKDPRWINNVGDLGLLVWLCAIVDPERLLGLDAQLDLKRALPRFHESRRARTMELSWFLSGLAHQNLACPDRLPHLRETAMEAYGLLKKNQGEHGIFSHLAEKGGWTGLMRGRIGSFADQVYPIYALSKYSQSFSVPKAAERALDCALTLCELQGPLGEWWWHYDASTGKVLGRYPVYSVHQHGMAPMALLALGETVQSDFTPWVYKGLRWINGDNDLEVDMRDYANVIWRCVNRTDYKKHWDSALALLMAREDAEPHKDLAVLYETRPYELGWLLYAFAGHRTKEAPVF